MGDQTMPTIYLLVCRRTERHSDSWTEEAYTSRDDAQFAADEMNNADRGIPYQWDVHEVTLHYAPPERRHRAVPHLTRER
jgi:hypothetical protein